MPRRNSTCAGDLRGLLMVALRSQGNWRWEGPLGTPLGLEVDIFMLIMIHWTNTSHMSIRVTMLGSGYSVWLKQITLPSAFML